MTLIATRSLSFTCPVIEPRVRLEAASAMQKAGRVACLFVEPEISYAFAATFFTRAARRLL